MPVDHFQQIAMGMVQGEGAAIFVFENFDKAKKRGAEILAEVIGYAMSSDASDIVMPSKKGAARAIKGAYMMPDLILEDVQYINASWNWNCSQ